MPGGGSFYRPGVGDIRAFVQSYFSEMFAIDEAFQSRWKDMQPLSFP